MRDFDEAGRACAKNIEAENFDVLFVNCSAGAFMPNVLRYVNIPRVLYLQDPSRYLYEAAPTLPWVSTAVENLNHAGLFGLQRLFRDYPLMQVLRLQAKQEWLNAQACDCLLVNSYFSRENVFRAYAVDANVCYLGVDTKLFRNLGKPRERFLVGLGAIQPKKGIDLAIKALAMLPNPRPPLIWIGPACDSVYLTEVRALATALDVDLQIRQAVSDEELVDTLNRATLMLYPSRLEAFGLAPLEANACGLPVVAIAEGGVRETIRDGVNGILVDPDPQTIAGAIDRLFNNPTLARTMGEDAAQYVREKWNIDDSVDRLEGFLLKAAGK